MKNPASESEAFKAQFDLMTEQLVAVERRAKTLAELNRLLCQGRDPFALAQRAIDLVIRATRASGTFVYLWDAEVERLVLRVTTEEHQNTLVGHIRLRLGEGITGWSALMRQTVVLDDGIQQDPRFARFAAVDDSAFRSMIAVPIIVPGGDVLGVFSLYSMEPGAFNAHDVDLATEIGSLLASGLVQAQMLKDLRRQSAAARFLMTVPADATSSLQRCVEVLAGLIRDQVDATLCVVEIADRGRTEAQSRPGLAFAEHVDKSVVAKSRTVRSRADLPTLLHELDQPRADDDLITPGLEKFTTSFGTLFPIGAITCYRARPFTDADSSILEALGAQAAALVGSLTSPVMTAPLAGRLSAAPSRQHADRILRDLGWRPGPTQPVLVRISSARYAAPSAFDRVWQALQEMASQFDGVVMVPSAPTVSILLPHRAGQWRSFEQALRSVLKDLRSEAGGGISAGIGPLAVDARDLVVALEHAESALAWAELLDEPESLVHYQDVAHLRLLPGVAMDVGEDLRSVLGQFAEVVRYDLRHGTSLSATLDTYLASRCSVTDTASALFIHRNTLRQRLGRIEELTGQTIDQLGDWMVASLAARLAVSSGSQLTKAQTRTPARTCPRQNVMVGSGCCGMQEACALPAA